MRCHLHPFPRLEAADPRPYPVLLSLFADKRVTTGWWALTLVERGSKVRARRIGKLTLLKLKQHRFKSESLQQQATGRTRFRFKYKEICVGLEGHTKKTRMILEMSKVFTSTFNKVRHFLGILRPCSGCTTLVLNTIPNLVHLSLVCSWDHFSFHSSSLRYSQC